MSSEEIMPSALSANESEEIVQRLARAIRDAKIEIRPGEMRSVGYYIGVGLDAIARPEPEQYQELIRALVSAAGRAAYDEILKEFRGSVRLDSQEANYRYIGPEISLERSEGENLQRP